MGPHPTWVLTVLTCIWGTAIASDAGFDFFILVRQWGPTFCEATSCSANPVAAFTIHGLWPEYDSGNYPSYCTKTAFDINKLNRTLTNSLACSWVSYTGSNREFWAYEWDKHGTCALPVLPSQEAYFDAAVTLNERYEINRALVEAGINPRTAGTGTKEAFVRVLTDAFGAEPVVKCTSDRRGIEEIWMCFDLSLKLVKCPRSVSSSRCDSRLALPTGSQIPPVCQPYYNFG